MNDIVADFLSHIKGIKGFIKLSKNEMFKTKSQLRNILKQIENCNSCDTTKLKKLYKEAGQLQLTIADIHRCIALCEHDIAMFNFKIAKLI